MIQREKVTEDAEVTADSQGQLDTHEIYRIVRDLRAQQKDLDRERRAALATKKRADVVSLCATTLTLAAVAVLGVSFASGGARDTADVSANGSGVQEVKHDDAGAAARRMETMIHLDLDVSEAKANKGEESYWQPLAGAGAANDQQQQQEEEKKEDDGGRELRRGRGFYKGNRNRNNNNGRTRNNNDDLGTFSSQEAWERNCDQYLGRVDYDKFNRIRLRARSGNLAEFTLSYESRGLVYTERFSPYSAIVAREDTDTFMALEERAQIDCDDDECTVDRPAIVFRNCVGPTSTFSGNGGSGLETFIFEDRPEDGFDSSSSSSDDRRDLRGGWARNRANRGNRNRRNGNGGNNNVRNNNDDDDIARCDVYSCEVGQGVVFRPNSDIESRDWN